MTARYAISDTLVLAMRALRRIPRNPDLLTAYTLQPIMFTLLFVVRLRRRDRRPPATTTTPTS